MKDTNNTSKLQMFLSLVNPGDIEHIKEKFLNVNNENDKEFEHKLTGFLNNKKAEYTFGKIIPKEHLGLTNLDFKFDNINPFRVEKELDFEDKVGNI